MAPTRRAFLGAVAAGALAGCLEGGTDDGDGGGATPTATPTDSPTGTGMDGAAVVRVRAHDEYGDVLVGPDGLTLYAFTRDSPGESTCYDQCAEAWPPLTVESASEATAGEGVTGEVGTTERDDGSLQVMVEDIPLYYFASDEKPGDVNGQGVNDVWYVLRPDGTLVRSGSTPTGTATRTPTATQTQADDGGAGGY